MAIPTIGLALGGGAARGLSHIIVLEVLDELGVKPAFIAGTSIGALIGSAYASGLSALSIREHALSVLATPGKAVREMFVEHKLHLQDLIRISPSHPLLLSGLGLVKLVSPTGVAKRIEQTVIALTICATDFYDTSEVVMETGNMETAVAASIAIPGIIQAPLLDGRLLIDGAFSNPVPVDHLRAKGCDIILAVDVTGKPVKNIDNKIPGHAELMLGAVQNLQKQITRMHCDIVHPDILVVPDIDRFGAQDFFKIREILDAADPVRETLKRQLAELLEQVDQDI